MSEYKNSIEDILKKNKIDYTDEMLNFIAAVGLKESSGGKSAVVNYVEPVVNALTFGKKTKSLGEFQINPQTFKDYLPEDYDFSDRESQVKALVNFVKSQPEKYQYKGKEIPRDAKVMYSLYNTGKPDRSSQQIKKFQQIFDDLSKFK